MSNLGVAQQVDKSVAVNQFILEIRQHVVSLLKGTASERTQAMLYSPAVLTAFRGELSKIIQMGGPLATAANRIAPDVRIRQTREANKAILKNKIDNNRDLNVLVRETVGEEPPDGISIEGVLLWTICKLALKERRK